MEAINGPPSQQQGVASMINEAHVRLSDGRRLGYAEFGDPAGRPIFVFNGSASRLFHPIDRAADSAAGARIITVDRPGLGLSDFKPRRTLLDWADDIRELAESLAIERFAVAGGSAGGPYAAACAFRLPERITALALISSLAPFDIPEVSAGMTRAYRLIRPLTRYAPWLLRLSQSFIMRNPEAAWKQFYKRLPECDRAALRAHPELDFRAMLLRDLPEIYRQGSQGIMWDMAVLTGPWGFSPAAIRVKTEVWQGADDVNVPPAMGRYLAGAIPGCRLHLIAGEGHLMYVTHWPEIVAFLLGGR
jgi:pimeloyl-ACP methyl ester carboxylesterase